MIELENARISLPTVHAAVRYKIVENILPIFRFISGLVNVTSLIMGFFVAAVMLTTVLALAAPTVSTRRIRFIGTHRKL